MAKCHCINRSVTMWMRVLASVRDSVREQSCERMCAAILSWLHRNENREKEDENMWNENTAGINTDRTHSQRSNKSVHYIWIRVLGSQSNHTKWQRELHGNFIHMNWPQQHLKHFTRTERNTPTGQSPKQSTDKSFMRTCHSAYPDNYKNTDKEVKCLKLPLNMTLGMITIHP